MSALYDVDKLCLRYAVPFRYEEIFEDAFRKVDSRKEIWKRKCVGDDKSESDAFDYVRDEFCFENEEDALSEQKAGCEWLSRKNGQGKGVKQFLYFPNKKLTGHCCKAYYFDGEMYEDHDEICFDLKEAWDITILNVGLRLFRNGLGLIWYELKLKLPKPELDSAQLMIFQNTIKELDRGGASLLWEKQAVLPRYGIELSDIHPNNPMKYVVPFALGKWVNDTLDFLKVSYLAERESAYQSILEDSMTGLEGFPKKLKEEISKRKEAEAKKKELDGFKKKKMDESVMYPDKAILFTYVCLKLKEGESDSSRDRYEFSYHLTNGYTPFYHYSDEIQADIKRPFDNVCWYATQEGAAYLAWLTADNSQVFKSVIANKIKTDYFNLFLKTLYQSYSLLLYAEKIQTTISAVNEKYEGVTELFGEINLFLTKSMATSVSHIHHQTEFYTYLKKQLRVHEDVKSVTSGLNAIDMLLRKQYEAQEKERDRRDMLLREQHEEQEKERDGRLQAIMSMFTLLGISSALTDYFSLIGINNPFDNGFLELLNSMKTWEWVCFVVIALISVIAIGVIGRAAISVLKDGAKRFLPNHKRPSKGE